MLPFRYGTINGNTIQFKMPSGRKVQITVLIEGVWLFENLVEEWLKHTRFKFAKRMLTGGRREIV